MIISINKPASTTTKIDVNKVIQFLQETIKKHLNGQKVDKVYFKNASKEFSELTGINKRYSTYYTVKALKKLEIVENTDQRGVYCINVKKLFEYKF